MDLGAFLDHDQGPLELAGVLAVDPEVGLQRERDLDALRDVDERAAGPDRRVERGELVVLGRHDRAEVLAEDLGVLDQRLVCAHEHDAELGQLFLDRVVDDLGVVLRTDAGEELALRLGDPELLEGRLDLLRDVVPRLLFALGRLAVVDDLVEVDLVEAVRPRGNGPLEEMLIGAETVLEHPVRLVLDRADLFDGGPSETTLRLAQIGDVVVEGELVALVGDDLAGGGHEISGRWLRHSANSDLDYRD